ncbi:DUF937 domain-containing protein [Fibrivirga algicola]|uniref:DUF937 domain-containing protein n=1 Tax=Fibrivirga algicola TaxID=2950420 RepID=A0ABX0QKC3_9BACT|nr:DUF937 domain-containing protein [Fibrivirga algicola]ARK12080.1 hypothetical protein A6C57_18065 [Fibrella sp. ES10-3-2-2]NID11088.1 hypothetical protein [Fibrivirga algicola]
MFETLMNLVQQNAGSSIINNPAIPNEHNNTAMETVVQSMMGGLSQQAQGGGLGNLLGMVVNGGGNVQDNPVTQGVQQNVEQSLMQKLGISPQVAMSIASTLVPIVLSKMMNKAADPNDPSIDGNSIMGAATGKQGMDWMGMAGSAMADGKLDMNDLMRVAGGQLGGGTTGGLGGMLGGLFGGK